MGSVLLEVDRYLKGLVHGKDNLTHEPVRSSVPGYLPVAKRLRCVATGEIDKPQLLDLRWFVSDESGQIRQATVGW